MLDMFLYMFLTCCRMSHNSKLQGKMDASEAPRTALPGFVSTAVLTSSDGVCLYHIAVVELLLCLLLPL